jgi:hypothetical protein
MQVGGRFVHSNSEAVGFILVVFKMRGAAGQIFPRVLVDPGTLQEIAAQLETTIKGEIAA